MHHIAFFFFNETYLTLQGGQPGLQNEFQDSQGCSEKLCLKKPKKQRIYLCICALLVFASCVYPVLQMVVSHPVGIENGVGSSMRTVLALNSQTSLQSLLNFTVKHEWCTEVFFLSTLYT